MGHPVYDIHNKILKLNPFTHFYFWPLLAASRPYLKTFFMTVIQLWLGGRFEGPMEGQQHTWNQLEIPHTL